MTEAELSTRAWQVLGAAWALQWVLIIGAGSGPMALMAVSLRKGWQAAYTWAQKAQKIGALLAVLFCVQSTPLWLDTYKLESGALFWEELSCAASLDPAQPAQPAECGKSQTRELSCGSSAHFHVLYVLQHSRKVLGISCENP